MSWYFVDASGQTQGPFEVSVMKQKYASKLCSDESYIWNGTSVNQWTPLKQVPELLNQVKVSQPAPARPSRPAGRRPNPFGGGGRANLLASISRGAQLKKVDKKDINDSSSAVGGSSGGGGGGGGSKRPMGGGGGMDLMSQLKAKQAARAGKSKSPASGGGGGGGGWSKPKSSPKPATSSPSKPSGGGSKWGNKSGGGGATGGAAARKNKIKTKIDNLTITDWQFKAIEKILS